MWWFFGWSPKTPQRPSRDRRTRSIIDLQLFERPNEMLYPPWWTQKGLISWYRDLPDDTFWNCYICAAVLIAIVVVAVKLDNIWYVEIFDAAYNISYAAHVIAIGYKTLAERENMEMTFWIFGGYLIDMGTFSHYVSRRPNYKLGCYYLRLHRPFKYLWSLYDYNLRGSILGTTMKYCYIFMVLRITWAWIWLHVNLLEQQFDSIPTLLPTRMMCVQLTDMDSNDSDATKFLSSLYIVNKMFIPIGIPVVPDNDIERVTCLFVILSGCLVVTGAAVATLSLVISLYMSPEETFRSRYRLIIKEMRDSLVPLSLREKVQKFYHMYWHKQRAVSKTQLLPTFPPTLPATVYTDIYFEATQKSRILRELSYQFLSELAKKMETIHYIPGDAIIERSAKKSAIIFITYGDIEMLTAEDDITAILRFTRGTVLSPCGGAAGAAVTKSHLAVRAATFCTAHVLHAADLWRLVNKHSVSQDNAGPILAAFNNHINKVKRHYMMKVPVASVHKSSILHFNRNLMALKEKKDANGMPLLARTDVFLEIAGCYIMRNRLDSSLTDESDAICLRPTFPCILQPYSSLLMAWHTAVAILILIICITHPYYLVFLKTAPMEFRFFDYMATAVYVVDHIVHLSTGAHVEEGVPITFAQTSSQQMRSKWFVLDVVGTLPIFEFIGDGHFAGINKILRLPKVFRLLKTMEDSWVYHSNVLRFCSYTLLLLIACYLVAAMQQAFMCYQSGYCLVTNFTHSPFWEESELDDETVMARLIFGLYWAISMITFTTHMETWGKENMSNVMYTMIILEFCIVLRTFMEAVYSATIMVTTAMRENYDARIATVKRFLIRNEVDPELRSRFITYLQLCWYTDKAYKMTHNKETASIFYDLPQHVYQDIVGRNRTKYVLCIPFMKMLKKEELKQLAANANLYYTSPNEILMNTGDLVNEMYVVVKGICEVICPNTRTSIGQYTAKNHFGDVVCLLRIPAYFTVRAVTHVQIFCISMRHLKPVFENPQIKEAIEYLKTQPEYTRLQKGTPSFLKYEPLPPIPNTERFPLPRKHEHDFVYLYPFLRLGFLSILRYIFPRFTIRPDGKYLIRYEWFRVSCALVSAMVFPNYTYLVLQWPWLYYLTWLLDLSAIFDIFQRMLVAYYNEDGVLVYHPSSTAANYIKGPFIIDLIGCLALEKLESERIETYENGYRVTPIEQTLMMNRLLQLYRFPSIMQTLQYYIERQDILLIIYAVPLFISMFNILTCLMVFNSVKIFYFVDGEGQNRWLLEPFDDKGGSWIELFRNTFRFNLTSSPWNLYLATHFWVVYETTSTGYAKFKPSNNSLMEILFIGTAMSAMIVTYFSVRIISIRSNVNKPLAGFQQHMRDIAMFVKRENLDTPLQKEIRCYYEYNWEKMGGINYRGMLKLCNQITLRTDAILHIYGPTFAKCPLLAQCDVSLLRMIGRSVRSIYFVRDMKIIECDDVVTDLYFVDYGGVESRVAIGEINQVVRLPRGSLFGNLEGTPTERVPMDIVATSRLHLLMINAQAFYHIISEFPATKELMEQSRIADNKHYILGNMEEFKVKFTRHPVTVPFRPRRMDVIKYIYFQKGLIQLYLIIVSLICIYMDLYNAGYQDNRAWLILTLYILDMLFFMKILMQFSLPLLVTKKYLKALLLPIRRMYFKREFKYDMISCVPIELLSLRIVNDRWFYFSWLRLNRMFRIVTIYNCLKRRNERVEVSFILNTILTVAVWFSVFVHATTCLWYFIGMLEEQAQPKSSWLYNDDGSSWCGNEYICSLYFIMTTFTQNGVGDIMPKKQSEVIFVTILMIISTMVFMIYVGEFSNIIQYQSFRSFSFYSKYLELQAFLNNNRVSKNLVTKVKKYTLHLWRESRGIQFPHFLSKAPLSLRLRVMSAAYMHHMSRHHIFQNCEPAFLRQLVGCLRLYTYNEEMYVVKEKEITNCMYVIHRGKVKETSLDTESMILARVYPAGSYFGVLQGLVRNTPYTYSYQTMIKSQVLTLHLDDWEYLLAHFPLSKAMIHKNMGSLDDKDIDNSKWPGGYDPDFDPDAAATQTKTDANISNLPKFYDSTLMADGRPLEAEQISIASTISWQSKNEVTLSPTPSVDIGALKISPSLDTVKVDTEKEKEEPKMGILDKIVSTAKKLMGRYSDSDISSSISEVREDLVLEEDATGTLLKQLDEAIRLSRERIRKSKYRHRKDIDADEEEMTEKYMFAYDMDTDESKPADSKATISRQLRIRDDDDIVQGTKDLNTTAGSDTTVMSIPELPSTIPLSNLEKKEISSILKQHRTIEKVDTTSDKAIASTSKAALETSFYGREAPIWGIRIGSDSVADVARLEGPQVKIMDEDTGAKTDIDKTERTADNIPVSIKDRTSEIDIQSPADSLVTVGNQSSTNTPNNQYDTYTASKAGESKPHVYDESDTQPTSKNDITTDSRSSLSTMPISEGQGIISPAVDAKPEDDVDSIPSDLVTTEFQSELDNNMLRADEHTGTDSQPILDTLETLKSQAESDPTSMPDILADSQADSGSDVKTQLYLDIPELRDSQAEAEIKSILSDLEITHTDIKVMTENVITDDDAVNQLTSEAPSTSISEPRVDAPLSSFDDGSRSDANSQLNLGTPALADSQADGDIKSEPSDITAEMPLDMDTEPISDDLRTETDHPDVISQTLSDTLVTADIQPHLASDQAAVDTQAIPETSTVSDSHSATDIRRVSNVISTAIPQPPADAQSIRSVPDIVDRPPEMDAQSVLEAPAIGDSRQSEAYAESIPSTLITPEIQPDADTEPIPENVLTEDLDAAIPATPDISVTTAVPPDTTTIEITQPYADTQAVSETQITTIGEPALDTQILTDVQAVTDSLPDMDTLPIPSSLSVEIKQPDADTLPIPDSLIASNIQLDADVLPIPDSIKTTDGHPHSNTQSATDALPKATSQPISDTLIRQPIIETLSMPALASSQLDADTLSIPDQMTISNTAAKQLDADTLPIPENLVISEIHLDADTIPVPENLLSDIQPISETLSSIQTIAGSETVTSVPAALDTQTAHGARRDPKTQSKSKITPTKDALPVDDTRKTIEGTTHEKDKTKAKVDSTLSPKQNREDENDNVPGPSREDQKPAKENIRQRKHAEEQDTDSDSTSSDKDKPPNKKSKRTREDS